jgi:hypothetical protein
MYDLIGEASNLVQSSYSYWYRLFPDDTQFPAAPRVDEGMLTDWKGMRDIVEGGIEGCWVGDCVDGNWERKLYVKKILASAGF